jgi:hypothetical protein
MHHRTYNRSAYLKGYRSGLENKVAKQITTKGYPVIYEKEKIDYIVPERGAKYTPDFKITLRDGRWFYVETKGIFSVGDRQKHILIRDQHPEIDIRFVFSNSKTKLYKRSPTSYAQWCEKHGFVYADKLIPGQWFEAGTSPTPAPEKA